MTDAATAERRIRAFIVDELQWDESQAELTPDFPLIENHALDSLGIFQMVSFLENEYGVEIAGDELVHDNFGTIRGIAALLMRKGVVAGGVEGDPADG